MATSPIGHDRQASNNGFGDLYEDIAHYPEVGAFRKFAAMWAKLIHDDTQEVLYRREQVCKAMCEAGSSLREADVLNIARYVVEEKYPDALGPWKAYEEALRQQGRDLCMSSRIMQLPEQAPYATAFLKKFGEPIFTKTDKLRFGLTQEDAQEYLGPPGERDTCAWTVPPSDAIAGKVYELAPWFGKKFSYLLRRDGRKGAAGRNEPPSEDSIEGETVRVMRRPSVDHSVIVRMIDVLTCVGISILLMSTIFVLESIPRLKTRIGTTGALGTIFSVSVMLLAGPSRRIEVYAATVAFFAIACEFLSNASIGSSGR